MSAVLELEGVSVLRGRPWVFELRGHRIRVWRPMEDRAEALRIAGFSHA